MDSALTISHISINVRVTYIFSDIRHLRRSGTSVFNEDEVSESCSLKLLFNTVNSLLCTEVRY